MLLGCLIPASSWGARELTRGQAKLVWGRVSHFRLGCFLLANVYFRALNDNLLEWMPPLLIYRLSLPRFLKKHFNTFFLDLILTSSAISFQLKLIYERRDKSVQLKRNEIPFEEINFLQIPNFIDSRRKRASLK